VRSNPGLDQPSVAFLLDMTQRNPTLDRTSTAKNRVMDKSSPTLLLGRIRPSPTSEFRPILLDWTGLVHSSDRTGENPLRGRCYGSKVAPRQKQNSTALSEWLQSPLVCSLKFLAANMWIN